MGKLVRQGAGHACETNSAETGDVSQPEVRESQPELSPHWLGMSGWWTEYVRSHQTSHHSCLGFTFLAVLGDEIP